MRLLILSAVVVQAALPPVLLFWLWRRTPPTRVEWLAAVTVVLSTIAVLALVMPWSAVPCYLRYVYATAALGVTALSWRRVQHVAWRAASCRGRRMALAKQTVFAVLMAAVSLRAALGMAAPDSEHIDLACPFPAGIYLVVSGGNSRLLNSHLETLRPIARYEPWRGQSHGLDIVQIGRWGRRSDGLLPPDPARYYIHGQMVTAPCTGIVASVANDRPDMPVPLRDPDQTQIAGNHVMLDCGGIEVLLAHLLRGSVRVGPGDHVMMGQAIGMAGNSGNSTEPHLHLSAQRRAAGDAFLGGTPVWITIDGRYLVRNDRLDCG